MSDWFSGSHKCLVLPHLAKNAFVVRYLQPTCPNLSNPKTYFMYHQFQYSGILCSANNVFIYLYSINWLVFITEAESVYCAVRTGSLNQTDTDSFLKLELKWNESENISDILICGSKLITLLLDAGNLELYCISEFLLQSYIIMCDVVCSDLSP
jgi:hypothetical protein